MTTNLIIVNAINTKNVTGKNISRKDPNIDQPKNKDIIENIIEINIETIPVTMLKVI